MFQSFVSLTARSLIAVVALGQSATAYVITDSWTHTASGGDYQVGQPLTLTWGFASDGSEIENFGSSRLISFLDTELGAGAGGVDLTTRPWFPLFDRSFQRWAGLGGVEFVYEPVDDAAVMRDSPGSIGLRADIRLGGAGINGAGGTIAISQSPDSADIVFDLDDASRLTNPQGDYARLRNALMHEIGHTLGLDHVTSDSSSFLMEPELALTFDGPQIDDIRGLHHLYGDAFEGGSTGDALHLGVLRHGQVLAIGSGARRHDGVPATESDFVSIHSRADVDELTFEITSATTVDLALTPLGGVYRQAPVGEQLLTYNTSASNNLFFSVHDSDGELVRVAAAHVGQIESLPNFNLSSPGLYTVRIAGTRDAVQLYEFSITAHPVCEPNELSLAFVAFASVGLAGRRRPCGPSSAASPLAWFRPWAPRRGSYDQRNTFNGLSLVATRIPFVTGAEIIHDAQPLC